MRSRASSHPEHRRLRPSPPAGPWEEPRSGLNPITVLTWAMIVLSLVLTAASLAMALRTRELIAETRALTWSNNITRPADTRPAP